MKTINTQNIPIYVYWIIVILPIVILYLPALQYDFVNWDDPYYVYKNEGIKQFNSKTLKHFFSLKTIIMGNWHPLTMLSLALDYQLFGKTAFGFHLTNIILHLISCILIFQLGRAFKLSEIQSVFLGVWFGIHPLHLESVVWVTERKDVLFTAAWLGAWYVWWKQDHHKYYHYIAILLFIISVLSKAMAVSLPVILILTDYYRGKPIKLLRYIPFFIIALIAGGIGIYAQQTAEALSYRAGYTWTDNFAIAGSGVWWYMYKMLLPLDQSAFYPYPLKESGMLPGLYWAGFIGAAVLLALTIWAGIKKNFQLFFVTAFFLITVFPVIQLIPLGNARVADRYFYLSSFSLLLGFIWIINRIPFPQKYSWSLLLIPTMVWGYLAFERIPVWKNGETLWLNVIDQYPDQSFAWNNLGTLYFEEGAFDKAIPVYLKVLSLDTGYADGYNNLGTIYATRKNYPEAIFHFTQAVKYKSPYPAAEFNLGYALNLVGKTDSAIVWLKQAATHGHPQAQQLLTQNKLTW
jgi:hypothetical protein